MDDLVDELAARGRLSGRLEEVFRLVDRRFFVPDDLQSEAYADRPLPIGEDQTISQPSVVALMLSELDVHPGMRVLDVGCGSGWTTALLEELVGEEGEVVGVERIGSLVEQGRKNLAEFGSDARIVQAGDVLGLPDEAPFDRILVSAAADRVPRKLVDQLVDGGLMVLPVNDSLFTVRQTGDDFEVVRRQRGFRFVPLV